MSVYYSDVLFKGDVILIDENTVLIGTRTRISKDVGSPKIDK